MAHQQMLVLLPTVQHIKVGDNKEKNSTQEGNEKLEAATSVICSTKARDASAKIKIVEVLIRN
jgi:hypothetical protein